MFILVLDTIFAFLNKAFSFCNIKFMGRRITHFVTYGCGIEGLAYFVTYRSWVGGVTHFVTYGCGIEGVALFVK